MVYSWYLSYPLSVDSVNDVVFNHVSILYWVSLPLLLTSMYAIVATSKNSYLKWLFSVGAVLAIYSLSYFYNFLPGSDSHYFRGLNEYLINTGNLDPLVSHHGYFQWPSYFILAKVATSVSALVLADFEFLFYAIIGFLLATTLYVYVSKATKNGGFQAVAIFFISGFYFLNYQCVPFSLALVLLFILLMLESRKKSSGVILIILILFASLSLTHSFVPLFFILYLLARYLLGRGKQYGNLLLATSTIYLTVQMTIARFAFAQSIRLVMTAPSEYSEIVGYTLAPAFGIDVLAQLFSRSVAIASIAVCGAGIVFLLIKRKLRDLDKAILFMGATYSILGVFLSTLGSRALIIAFIPASVGVASLFGSRFRSYLKWSLILILLLLAFIPLHSSFSAIFETNEAYHAENFMIDYYNWGHPSLIVANYRDISYLQTKQPSTAYFESDNSPLFPRLKDYDSIVNTIELGKNLLRYNYTAERIFQENNINVIYNNGFSLLEIKSTNFTWGTG